MGKIIDNYCLQQQLGSGTYSKVYKGINIKTNQQVAIKMVKTQKFNNFPKLEEGTVNQINILTNLQYCPHIIKYYDMLKTVNNFYFIYEYCNSGTLQNLFKKSSSFSVKVTLNYLSQILIAFKVLNKHNIMHRDLKPDNILIHNGMLKIADFGFCKPLENQHSTTDTMIGSPLYMAPQVLRGQSYTLKADIWSLGVILFRMLFGYCPFQSNVLGKLIMMIDHDQIKLPSTPQIPAVLADLLKKMLTKDSNKRIDWTQIFTYEIKNGQINHLNFKQTKIMSKLSQSERSEMKRSGSTCGESNFTSSSFYTQRQTKQRNLDDSHHSSNNETLSLLQHNKNGNQFNVINSSRLETVKFSVYNNNRQNNNVKKDIMLKNHSKCIQIASMIADLCRYQCCDGLVLAYLFARTIQKQFYSILQSIKRDSDLKMVDQEFLLIFHQIVENELRDLRNNIRILEQQLHYCHPEIKIQSIQGEKKFYLKKFILFLKLQNMKELVLISRLLDFIDDSLIIRKEIYENMSKEQLAKKIKDKNIALKCQLDSHK